MLGHMRKHRTEEWNSSRERSKNEVSKESIDWRSAAKEAFGDMSSTALNLRGLRNREGLTQAQLGEAIGVEQSNISKMENGKRQIGAKIAKRIEKIFDIDYRLFL
jgi:DNA-binding XRE family transcriptional regulator